MSNPGHVWYIYNYIYNIYIYYRIDNSLAVQQRIKGDVASPMAIQMKEDHLIHVDV